MKMSQEDEDLLKWSWKIKQGYLCRKNRLMPFNERALHRIILARKLGRPLCQKDVCDHINGDRLDNRRENLRLVSRQGNAQNRKCGEFRGTHWNSDYKKWIAKVKMNEKVYYLGGFDDRQQAAEAARKKREELGFLSEAPVEGQIQ